MPTVNAAQFAEKIGVSKQRVMQGIEDGLLKTSVKITKKGSRKSYAIDLESGLQEWANNIDPSKQRDTTKQMDTKSMDAGEAGKVSPYQRAKAVNEMFKAKLAQLDYEEKAGKLVPLAQVKAEGFKIARNVRDSLMGLPERVSAEIANMNEPREIAIYLRGMIADALKDLDSIGNVGNRRN